MPEGGRIVWFTNTLTPHLFALPFAVKAGLHNYTSKMAKEVEEYARDNAPWEDRTGDARAGLTAESEDDFPVFKIHLFHTVDYGIWLEIRWDGRFAIIQPTLEHFGPQIMAGLSWDEILEW